MHSRTGINISFIPAALVIYAVLILCPFSSAYANYQDVETYSYDFLVETAEAADVTPNEFVVNYIFSSNIVTGQNMTDETGVSLSNDVETNLSHMRDTEEYPKWENLPDEWKQRWGTPKDYYSSKFNHLYSAGSGGRGYDVDMTQFEGSGGNDFSWTDDVHDKLVSIGRSFKKFLLGDANSVADVLANFLPDGKTNIESYMAVPNYEMFDGSDISGWPSGVPARIPVAFTNIVSGQDSNGNYYAVTTNIATYRIAVIAPGYTAARVVSFSEPTFQYGTGGIRNGSPPTPSTNATSSTYNDGTENHTYYWHSYYYEPLIPSTLTIPYVTVQTWDNTVMKKVVSLILFGGQNVVLPSSVPVIDYPENIDTSVSVYLPDNVNNTTSWITYITPGENSNPSNDLSGVISILRSIESKLGLLDSTSEDLTTLETAIAQFKFYTGGILKVHDEGIFDSLTDIGSDIHDILLTLSAWPKGDAPDAPDIIGDFDFDELQDKSDLLLESVSDLAPFGALLLMSEMVGILSQTGNLVEPEFVIPFQFMPGHSYDVTIDLSWLEDGRVYINFFCILSLILCLLNITIRIIELEAAS